MAHLEALIFDVDGTLVETERDGHLPAFNQAFTESGLSDFWDSELYGQLLAIPGGKDRIRYYWSTYCGRPAPEEGLIEALHRRKTELFMERVRTGALPARSGVRRLLQEARAAGVRLAIATTASRKPLSGLLTQTLGAGAEAWFEVIVAGEEVEAKKPSPEVYQRVLEALQLPPSACLAVEDSAPGVAAACGAGIPVIVTVSEYTQGQEFPGACAVLDQLGEPEEAPATLLTGEIVLPPHRAVDLETLYALHDRST